MKKADIPADEEMRLKSLRSLSILDTPPEERFDRIVRMARRMFDVPAAFISFIDADRQWFKASIGIDFNEISRNQSICAHAILGAEPFIIADAATDHRFTDGPLVQGDTNARFYASCPLKLPNGSTVGTLCIVDDHTRILDDDDLVLLRDLAATVEREFVVMQSAITDELTGIYNRKGFILAAQHSLNLCVRQDLPATLAYLDLSEFKSINENFGHAEGDRVLNDISRLLKAECRPSDIFARLGADQFVSLFINAPGDAAEDIMTRFRKLLRNSKRSNVMGYDCSFNYGIVEYDFREHKLIETLLADGASAMHASLLAEEDDVTAA
jgi:diguanylate cyclase (GGDEF)-like protein